MKTEVAARQLNLGNNGNLVILGLRRNSSTWGHLGKQTKKKFINTIPDLKITIFLLDLSLLFVTCMNWIRRMMRMGLGIAKWTSSSFCFKFLLMDTQDKPLLTQIFNLWNGAAIIYSCCDCYCWRCVHIQWIHFVISLLAHAYFKSN